MNGVLNLFVSIVQSPAMLVGLLAVLGLILQKKKATDVVQGGIKTFVGFLVLITICERFVGLTVFLTFTSLFSLVAICFTS